MQYGFEVSRNFINHCTDRIAQSKATMWLARIVRPMEENLQALPPFAKVLGLIFVIATPILYTAYQYFKSESDLVKPERELLLDSIPKEIQKILNQLFEKSSIKVNELPLYPKEIELKAPIRELMTAPIMLGKKINNCPMIIIQIDNKEKSLKEVIVLHQPFPSGSRFGGGKNEFLWEQPQWEEDSKFFTWNFTCPMSAKLTKSQKQNFANFQEFLATRQGTSVNGTQWTIPQQ